MPAGSPRRMRSRRLYAETATAATACCEPAELTMAESHVPSAVFIVEERLGCDVVIGEDLAIRARGHRRTRHNPSNGER